LSRIKTLEEESLKHREDQNRLREQLKKVEGEKGRVEKALADQQAAFQNLQKGNEEKDEQLRTLTHSLEQCKAAAKDGKAKRLAAESQLKGVVTERDQLRSKLDRTEADLAQITAREDRDRVAVRQAETRAAEAEAKRLVLVGQGQGAIAEAVPCRGELLWEEVHHLSPGLVSENGRMTVNQLLGALRNHVSDQIAVWRRQWLNPDNRQTNNVALGCSDTDPNPRPQDIYGNTGRWKEELDQIRGLILRVCLATNSAGKGSFVGIKEAKPRSTARVVMVGQSVPKEAYAAGQPGEPVDARVAEGPGPSQGPASVPPEISRSLSDISKTLTAMTEQQARLQTANEQLQRDIKEARMDHDIQRAILESELAKLRELAGEAAVAGNRGLQATYLAELATLQEEFAAKDRATATVVSGSEAEVPSEGFLAAETVTNVEMAEASELPPSEEDDLAETMAATKLLGDTKSQVSDKAESTAALNVFGPTTERVPPPRVPEVPTGEEADSSSGSEAPE